MILTLVISFLRFHYRYNFVKRSVFENLRNFRKLTMLYYS